MKKAYFKPLLGWLLVPIMLLGCTTGEEDTTTDGNTETPVGSSLTAYPQTHLLRVGESLPISLDSSVDAYLINSWEIEAVTEVPPEGGEILGEIDPEKVFERNFQFKAITTGITTVEYTVTGGGRTAKSEVWFAIQSRNIENTAPVVSTANVATSSEQPITIDLNHYMFDADGDALTLEKFASTSSRFEFDKETRTVTYTPDGYIGVENAVYGISDGRGGFALGYLVVNSQDTELSRPNAVPEARDYIKLFDATNTPTLELDLLALGLISDVNTDDVLVIDSIISGDGRVEQIGDSKLLYTPAEFIGVDQFVYTITDGIAHATGVITITVSNGSLINQVPETKPIEITIQENNANVVPISVVQYVSDEDDDELRLHSLINVDGIAQISPEDQLLINYQLGGVQTQDKFYYVVTDGEGGFSHNSITVNVKPRNPNPPVTQPAAMTMRVSDGAKTLDLTRYVDDEFPKELIFRNLAGATSPAEVKFSQHGVIEYTPNGVTGIDTITYEVFDGLYATEGVVMITVTADDQHNFEANDFTAIVMPNSENTEIDWLSNIEHDAADLTDEDFEIFHIEGVALGNAIIEDNKLLYTPFQNKYGKDQVIYVVRDKHHHYAQGFLTIEIPEPETPVITRLEVDGPAGVGNILTADVEAERCEFNGEDICHYHYRWRVNSVTVSEEQNYTYRQEDVGYNLRLEVTVSNDFDLSATEHVVYSNVTSPQNIYSNNGAFAALTDRGAVVSWGKDAEFYELDAELREELGFNVARVFSTNSAFAALKGNRLLLAWGNEHAGGDISKLPVMNSVVDVAATSGAFAAISEVPVNDEEEPQRHVITWGDPALGGTNADVKEDLSLYTQYIFSNPHAFVAVSEIGKLTPWGDRVNGGDDAGKLDEFTIRVDYQPKAALVDVQNTRVFANTDFAFAVIGIDNNVVAWGHELYGGSVPEATQEKLIGIDKLYSNKYAFAALTLSKKVVTWGDETAGGTPVVKFVDGTTSPEVVLENIKNIYQTEKAFAAIDFAGKLTTWGSASAGGDSSSVAEVLDAGILDVAATSSAFAVITKDRTVRAWGSGAHGGAIPAELLPKLQNIRSLYANDYAFAAVTDNGEVFAWGDVNNGGEINELTASNLRTNVQAVFATNTAFAALRTDGQIFAWGKQDEGGDASKVEDALMPSFVKVESSLEDN